MLDIKRKLLEAAKVLVEKKINTSESAVASAIESKLNETKSTAGDKFETGRAMMQVEQEKSEMRLAQANQLMNKLKHLDLEKKYTTAAIGALVTTDQHNYFLSIGIGKLVIDDQIYYAISELSPIGKLLIGKMKGEAVEFRQEVIRIKEIY